ncbi:hypothetical protein [Gracilimonas sp. BCB1]|uniref:hypothetical protein n=1 Tax=Gracilimonas sp. BCB1 TaxID=3152362 RepID=UPI0032D96929
MKPFDIEITSISKGPEELTYQLPINATVQKQIPAKNRSDYFIAELENSVFWVDKKKGINTEINHIVICTKKKSQFVEKDMKDVIIAIAYVLDESVNTDKVLDLKKIKYVADGTASATKKWGLF